MTTLNITKADIVIIGGSLGGCTAALSALKMGKQVIMTEETDWIGGQLTNQAVPPDEHKWIESFGCTRSYRNFRDNIRKYYKDLFPVTQKARENDRLNPGTANVSRISHEPRAALHVLTEMLAPYVNSGKLTIMTEHIPVHAETKDDAVTAVTVQGLHTGKQFVLQGAYFIDATECGDLLPLAGVEYVTGAESKQDFGEPHAVDGAAEPQNMQAFTYCFAMDYIEGENHTIERPAEYDFWKDYQAPFWPAKQLSWYGLVPHTLEPIEYSLFPEPGRFSLWEYRQIIDKDNFEEGTYDSSITIVNWPQNDYWLGSIIDVSEEERQHHLYMAKQLSLSLLYWMQTEAPRPDGGKGYPGLRLRKDVVGTEDGLAKYPYIREARRIQSLSAVTEQHISAQPESPLTAAVPFEDSVGVGCYRIDLHPSTGLNTFIDISAYPFQIPLGSLIPVRVKNVLPASKNIGTTHITNGCYRVHPSEWNIGEAVGHLSAYCMTEQVTPKEVRENKVYLTEFQQLLKDQGFELEWPHTHSV